MKSLIEVGKLVKKVYQKKVGGYPDDLVRIYENTDNYCVVRNDDTETAIKKEDITNQREEKIAEALRNFALID